MIFLTPAIKKDHRQRAGDGLAFARAAEKQVPY
jgi:hypothetical protein